jgi:hypothetical protein
MLEEKFNLLFPEKKTPHYATVKKKDPLLYEKIMLRYNGYRSFLRAIKRPMPKTSRRERAFIKYSSEVSRRYYLNCWSSLEETTFAVLALLGEEASFIHNFPFPSPKGSFYKLDFYDFERMLILEVDGVFHTALPNQKARDEEKDKYLRSFGNRVLRLTSANFKDLRYLRDKISKFLRGGQIEV